MQVKPKERRDCVGLNKDKRRELGLTEKIKKENLGWISRKIIGSETTWIVKYCPMESVRTFTLNHSYNTLGNKAAPASRRQVHNILGLLCSQPRQKHHQILPCFGILVHSVLPCFGITELTTEIKLRICLPEFLWVCTSFRVLVLVWAGKNIHVSSI